jgi:hypothetical protein
MGTEWVQVQGSLMHISVGYGPVLWGVDYGHQVWFKQLGHIKQEDNPGWIQVEKPEGTQKMIQLDVGRDGNVWGTDDAQRVFMRLGVHPDSAPSGTEWADLSNGQSMVNVAVCTDGHVWAVSNDN